MSFENNPPEGVRPDHELPPELDFLFDIPDMTEWNAHEIHVWIDQRNASIRQHAAELSEYAVNAEKLIAYFDPLFRNLGKMTLEYDAALKT
jgi:hypothetical protein